MGATSDCGINTLGRGIDISGCSIGSSGCKLGAISGSGIDTSGTYVY